MATAPRVRIAVPSEGPLLTAILVCPTCGQVVLPTIARMGNGRISGVTFYHTNEEYGCAWKNVDPMRRTPGETSGLVTNVRSGVDNVTGQPKFINEFDLSTGKSFDVDGLKPQDLSVIQFKVSKEAGEDMQKGFTTPLAPMPGSQRKFVVPTKQGGAVRPGTDVPAKEEAPKPASTVAELPPLADPPAVEKAQVVEKAAVEEVTQAPESTE